MVLTEEQTVQIPRDIRLKSGVRDVFSLTFMSMGTDCQVDYRAPSHSAAQAFRDQVTKWLGDFEKKYSRYIESSMICEINRQAGRDWVKIDPELHSMLSLCDWFYWKTSGVFDPSAYPLLKLWDYQAENPTVPSETSIQEAQKLIGWEKVEREEDRIRLPEAGMALDIGGIGKEYAVDRVFEMGQGWGIDHMMVNFGHDLRVQGSPPEGGPWRIGLEDPNDSDHCWGGLRVTDRAVASSGNYLRNFQVDGKSYSHIVDLRTGYPVENGCLSVSVVAPTCTEAGILSTTALILGSEEGLDLLDSSYQVEGCIWVGKHCLQTRRFGNYVIS